MHAHQTLVESRCSSLGIDLDKFKGAARELETDDDPERFRERLKKLVRHKRVEPKDG